MFSVHFTPEAKTLISEQFACGALLTPGLMIHRQGPTGEVTRAVDGAASWAVERRHPWKATVGEYGSVEAALNFESIPVWLALIPKPREVGALASLEGTELVMESLSV